MRSLNKDGSGGSEINSCLEMLATFYINNEVLEAKSNKLAAP